MGGWTFINDNAIMQSSLGVMGLTLVVQNFSYVFHNLHKATVIYRLWSDKADSFYNCSMFSGLC